MVTRFSVVPVRRIITVSDAEGYSNRRYDDQRDLQNRMADIQQRAATNAGLDLQQAIIQGRGDGSLIAWPPETSEVDLLTNYLRELSRELDRVNGTLSKGNKIRMRLAVTTGLVEVAAQGIPGQAAIKATLLADSELLREALRNARGHSLAVIIDETLFEDVVKTGLRGLQPETYEKVVINDKNGENHAAWITILGTERKRVSAFPEGGINPARASQPDSGGMGRKRGWPLPIPIPITVALIGATGAIIAAIIAAQTGGNPSPGPTAISSSSPIPGPADTTTLNPTDSPSPGSSSGKLHSEIAWNHLGTDVYRDPMGDAIASGPDSIPFGTHVLVKCWAPNESGMGSINVFYLIETSPWKGEYAPANTFLNGNTSGALDPRVPQCQAT